MQPETKTVPFFRRYWWLLVTLVTLGAAVAWFVAWGLAANGVTSLYWFYLHFDASTAFSAFVTFSVLALMVVVGLLRALFRQQSQFRWLALLWGVFISVLIISIANCIYADYDDVQELASVRLDGHTYQWLEYKDFTNPYYTLLECDSAGVICQPRYTYYLAIICNNPRTQTVQTLPRDNSATTPTLSVNPIDKMIAAQLNGETFFTYDIDDRRGVGPCEK
ncbi:MAG: hypothetical protein JNJ61_18710 [Anaerolineae bacterium]|nr:hypothetical protein [Anaerolineae bacterium]